MDFEPVSRITRVPLMQPQHSSEVETPLVRSPAHHRERTDWIEVSSVIRSSRVHRVLSGFLAITFLTAIVIGAFSGTNYYSGLAFPHRAVHASLANLQDGSDVVKPYFGPHVLGGINEITLEMTLWFRPGERLPTAETEGVHMGATSENIGEQGYTTAGDSNDTAHMWEAIWTGSLNGLSSLEGTRRQVVPVVLPGRILYALVMDQSQLVATFELRPTSLEVNATIAVHASTRPTGMYGTHGPWPLPIPMENEEHLSSVESFLAHASAGHPLKHQERFYLSEQGNAFSYGTSLAHTSWVTFASDYSVYRRSEFLSAMDALRAFKDDCASHPWWYQYQRSCLRVFAQDGHFENLLSIDNGASGLEWRYGPFLTTRLSPQTSASLIYLPEPSQYRDRHPSEISDFSFNWTVAYAPMSPAKLALFKMENGPDMWNKDFSDTAIRHDQRELYVSFFGLSFNPEARPILRGAIGAVSRWLRYLAVLYVIRWSILKQRPVLHYWSTRRTSAGIAILTAGLETVSDLVYWIVTACVQQDGYFFDNRGRHISATTFLYGMVVVGAYVALTLKQLQLLLRPEFRMSRSQCGGLFRISFPVAFRFRPVTVAERASFQLDSRFNWRQRTAIALAVFNCLQFATWPPPIIQGKHYDDMMDGSGVARHFASKSLRVLHVSGVLRSSIWSIARLSQILLNHRRKSFGGNHAVTTYMLLAADFLSCSGKILYRILGQPEFLRPYTLWDVITSTLWCALAGQAMVLKPVQQVELQNDVVEIT